MNNLFKSSLIKVIGLLVFSTLLMACFTLSILLGFTSISLDLVIEAFTSFNGSHEHLVITTTRLPRAIIASLVGASLAIAGALMQALTKNPLASPSIFGINAGAGFFIVLSISYFSFSSLTQFTWVAFIGAGIAAITVYLLGNAGRDGLTPMKLTLAGGAITALFSSLTQGMLVLNERALEEVLFWLAGSVEGRKLEMVYLVLPYIFLAWLISILMANQINILSLGEDIAKGLGQHTILIKAMIGLVVVMLAGSSVAVAGPISFIGIVIPHLARFLVGNDHKWLIPYCAVLGAILLLVADVGARYIIMPKEVPVGVMTALIGTPFFIYVARKGFAKT
ncbi:MAG: FecCD family ABC transporter permease [Bacillota bacterium]